MFRINHDYGNCFTASLTIRCCSLSCDTIAPLSTDKIGRKILHSKAIRDAVNTSTGRVVYLSYEEGKSVIDDKHFTLTLSSSCGIDTG